MYQINPDISLAQTLPGRAYQDAEWYAWQMEAIFARSWQYLPLALNPDHNAIPFTLLPESLNEPLLLTQTEQGWHCLSNVCTHRGALLQTQAKKCRILQCPYHGRSFNLRGRFQGMPAFEQAQNFPSPSDDLPELPLEHYGPFAFTALSTPEYAFADWIAPLKARLDWVPWQDFTLLPEQSRDYPCEGSWMLYCENYLEGLHIPYIHPALNQALDFKQYRTERLPHGVLQIGIAAEHEACFDLPAGHPDAGLRVAAYYFWLFPNFMLNLYPWGASLNLVEPQGVQRSRIRYQTWLWDPSQLHSGAGGNVDQTEQEDQAIIGSVRQGLQSRLYGRGRYSPSMEQGVHHFHSLLTRGANEMPNNLG